MVILFSNTRVRSHCCKGSHQSILISNIQRIVSPLKVTPFYNFRLSITVLTLTKQPKETFVWYFKSTYCYLWAITKKFTILFPGLPHLLPQLPGHQRQHLLSGKGWHGSVFGKWNESTGSNKSPPTEGVNGIQSQSKDLLSTTLHNIQNRYWELQD